MNNTPTEVEGFVEYHICDISQNKGNNMNRQEYDEYIAAFNARDYDLLHSRFFHPDVQIWTVGHVMDGQKGVRAFYDYFHEYVKEQIRVLKFAQYEGGIFAEVGLELTGIKNLTREINVAHGFDDFPVIEKGPTYKSILFADYELKDGKIYKVRCAEYLKPTLDYEWE